MDFFKELAGLADKHEKKYRVRAARPTLRLTIPPLQGLLFFVLHIPRALPWADIFRPVGAVNYLSFAACLGPPCGL